MTHRYVEADLAMKNEALARLQPPAALSYGFQPDDDALLQLLRAITI